MRAHATVRVKCWVRVTDRVRFRVRVMFKVMFRVRVRCQESPDTDPTAEQLSPRRSEWSTQGKVQVRISFWVPRPDKYMGHPSVRPKNSSSAAAIALWK